MTWCQVLSFLLEDVRTGSLGLRDSGRAEQLLSKHDIWVYVSGTYAILAPMRQGQADHWTLWPTNWKISSVSEWASGSVRDSVSKNKVESDWGRHPHWPLSHTAVCVLPDSAYMCTRKIQAHSFQLFSPLIFVTTELNSPVLVLHYFVLSSGAFYVHSSIMVSMIPRGCCLIIT